MPYPLLLEAHSILRWVVILTGVWALLRFWSGFLGQIEWTRADRMSGLIFSSFLNLQVLLGLVLYAVSPMIKFAMTHFDTVMKDPVQRFFAVEHPTAMLAAAIIAQVGYSVSKRAGDDRSKFFRGALFYTLAILLVLAAIPWPFMKYGRPLFRVLGN